MIGQHAPKEARDTHLKSALVIGLEEALTALKEALHDLTDDQAHAFPIRGRNNIAWIVMHSLQVLDACANRFQTGQVCFAHDRRWDLWECSQGERPKAGDAFPAVAEMKDILDKVCQATITGLSAATERDLLGKRHAEGWWKGNAADAYVRAIFHAMAHVRQIWLLRGALGLTDGKTWPQQHWA